MLIRNMGLFWREDAVYWGEPGPGHTGRLLGRLSTARRGGVVDFWEQRGIYALYADYRIVYVGQTAGQDFGKRLRDHRRDDKAERWDRFSWFGLKIVNADNTLRAAPTNLNERANAVLDHIEAILTIVAEPPLNRQRGRWRRIEQYLQEPSEAGEPEQDTA